MGVARLRAAAKAALADKLRALIPDTRVVVPT